MTVSEASGHVPVAYLHRINTVADEYSGGQMWVLWEVPEIA